MNKQKNSRLANLTRIGVFIAAILLIMSRFFPLWEISLIAPQYPEGLELYIHADKLSGEVDIVNGLNNYIGMKHLVEDEFIEFAILPYLMIGIGIIGLLAAFVNRKWLFYTFAGIFATFGIASMVDFYMWLYDYGHNLNPEAPIKVPGMTYQPPMFGYKQLLNFQAYSMPTTGGWLMAGAGGIVALLVFYEFFYRNKKKKA